MDKTIENVFDMIREDAISSKTLIMLRGPPGSGKTSLAQELCRLVGASVFTTDDFFVGEDGTYVYNRTKLAEYHRLNLLRAKDAMDKDETVIVPNTSIHLWEMREYVRYAVFRDYHVIFVQCIDNEKNEHGVSSQKVEAMRKQFESVTSLDAVMQAHGSAEKSSSRFIARTIDRTKTVIETMARMLPAVIDRVGIEGVVNGIKKRKQKRRDHGLHMTLVSPGHSLSLVQQTEAQRLVETAEITITGAGYVADAKAFYLVCDPGPDVVEWRARTVPGEYWPHITLGFTENDIHGVVKSSNIPTRNPHDEVELTMCELLIDPEVEANYRSCPRGGFEGVMFKAREVPGIGDDITYSTFPDLGKKLRRGHMFVRVGEGPWQVGALGLPKFSGMKGSEDTGCETSDIISHSNVLRIRAAADQFVVTLKENGAAGCLRFLVRNDDGTFVALVGTKLVISFFKYDPSINRFESFAKTQATQNQVRNARAFEALLRGHTGVVDDLVQEKITVNVEVLDRNDKHIVAYAEQEDICAVILALTLPDGTTVDLSWADARNLRTVQRKGPFPIAELDQQTVVDHQTEGCVVTYFKQGMEIGKEKIKSFVYVFKRSIRQVTMVYIADAVKSIDTKKRSLDNRKKKLKNIKADTVRRDSEVEIDRLYSELAGMSRTLAVQRAAEKEKHWTESKKFAFLNKDCSQAIQTMKEFVVWYGTHFDSLPNKADEFSRTFPDVWQRFSDATGFTGFV
jgi:shikimate kinase